MDINSILKKLLNETEEPNLDIIKKIKCSDFKNLKIKDFPKKLFETEDAKLILEFLKLADECNILKNILDSYLKTDIQGFKLFLMHLTTYYDDDEDELSEFCQNAPSLFNKYLLELIKSREIFFSFYSYLGATINSCYDTKTEEFIYKNIFLSKDAIDFIINDGESYNIRNLFINYLSYAYDNDISLINNLIQKVIENNKIEDFIDYIILLINDYMYDEEYLYFLIPTLIINIKSIKKITNIIDKLFELYEDTLIDVLSTIERFNEKEKTEYVLKLFNSFKKNQCEILYQIIENSDLNDIVEENDYKIVATECGEKYSIFDVFEI